MVIQKSLTGFAVFISAMPLLAMHDYRCTDTCLCEEHHSLNVSSFDKAFEQGNVSGNIRVAYINQDNAIGADSYATSIGGELKYETAKFYHTSFALSTFISQKVSPLSGDFDKDELNLDFFDSDGSSFAYLGEAYIDYNYKNFDVRIGRQKLDTPLNDRDDIRMVPNTFEAVTIGYGGIEDFVFMAGYITRWAGFDSGEDISAFKDIPGDISATGEHGSHAYLAGVMNSSVENLDLQAWYYDFDKLAGVLYADAVYESNYNDNIPLSLGLQYAHYHEKSSSMVEGNVYGVNFATGYNIFNISAAYNSVDTQNGKIIVIGHGGGPYFTSMEEMTIDAISNAQAYVVSADMELFQNLTLSYAFGHFDGKDGLSDVEYEENDVILAYQFYEKLDVEASYADINDKKNSGSGDTGYKRGLVRLNYNF